LCQKISGRVGHQSSNSVTVHNLILGVHDIVQTGDSLTLQKVQMIDVNPADSGVLPPPSKIVMWVSKMMLAMKLEIHNETGIWNHYQAFTSWGFTGCCLFLEFRNF
jgi:hypothetical protein